MRILIVFLLLGFELVGQSIEEKINLEIERKERIQSQVDSIDNILIDLKQRKISIHQQGQSC
jgi:hypothetical protein